MSRPNRWAPGLGPLAAAGLALALAGPAGAAGRSIERRIPVGDQQQIQVEFPYGELEIEPTEGDSARVVLTARCERWGGRCEDRLERVLVEHESRGDRLVIRVTGVSKVSNKGLQLRLRLQVPARDLSVDMTAGDVLIEDLRQDVRVDLKAGDVDIRMPEDRVRSVDVHVAVGDASLRLPGQHVEASRSHLVGGSVRWDEGRGTSRIEVDLSAGDATIRLD
jgi:hypothetical protein